MSDQEMQFFSGDEQDASSEQHSVTPEWNEPEDKASLQALERVWGRLEEHVSRNREYYQHNRNVPALMRMQASPEHFASLNERSPKAFKRIPWRHLDMIAAIVFLTLLLGGLLTFVYSAQQHSTLGSSGKNLAIEREACKLASLPEQLIVISEDKNGAPLLSLKKLYLRQGAQLVWINKTNRDQNVINADTSQVAIKVALNGKSMLQQNTKSTYYVQQAQIAPHQGPKSPDASLNVEIVNIVTISANTPFGKGATFDPPMLKVSQGSDLIWINATKERQTIINVKNKDERRSFEAQSCQMQAGLSAGNSSYTLENSSDIFNLFVA